MPVVWSSLNIYFPLILCHTVLLSMGSANLVAARYLRWPDRAVVLLHSHCRVYFLRKNRDLPFSSVLWMFGSFSRAASVAKSVGALAAEELHPASISRLILGGATPAS